MKMLGTVAVGIVRESRKFSGHPYVGRIARSVIFAIAQLSCYIRHTHNFGLQSYRVLIIDQSLRQITHEP